MFSLVKLISSVGEDGVPAETNLVIFYDFVCFCGVVFFCLVEVRVLH